MSRYASSYLNPQGPGDARPTAMQILEDEGMEGKLKGKVIVITGCSSGLGVGTACVLSKTGATLYLTARNLTKAKGALSGILEPGRVELVEMDNTSLDSVRTAASTILQKSNNQVNILINNAGVMAIETLEYTKDGYELQFGTNHLSHFLLFQLLKPALLASSTPELHSRVVNLTSSLHRFQSINDSDNYNFQKGDYKPWFAYGQSKTANLYMTNEIERRYGSRGLHATAVHPGIILTPLHQHVDDETKSAMASDENLPKTFRNEEQGAATTIYAAIGKEWEDKGGKFLEDCAEATRGEDGYNFGGTGFVSHSYDPEREARLWKDSLAMVGVKDDA